MKLDFDITDYQSHDNVEGQRPPLIDSEGVMRIDNSSFEHFTTCARSAQYYLIEERTLVADRVALRFGGAWHIAMEIFYRTPKESFSLPEFLVEVRRALDPYFDKYPPPPDDHRTLKFLIECLITYVGFAQMIDDFEILSDPNGPLIERYFEFDLGSVHCNSEFRGTYYSTIKVVWCGRIDLVIRRTLHEEILVMDHKTTAILGANFFADFANSSQMLGYVWAAQQLLGKPVAGLYLNAVAVRRPSKSGMPFEVPTRQTFLYDPERLEEWKYNTLVLVSDFLSHLHRGYFPMETKWCVGKYGPCQYLDVCTMPPAQRHAVLGSNTYEKVTWAPKLGTRQ